MATTTSRWRRHAAQVIQAVLAALPPGLSVQEKRRACREHYPFGERRYHPYKIWLAELQRQIPTPRQRQEERPVCLRFRLTGDLPFWVDVQCDYCPAQVKTRGCLMCRQEVDRLDGLLQNPEFRRWQRALRADRSGWPAFSDWLEEWGYLDLAEQLRGYVSTPSSEHHAP